jgi:hypothetical protein
MTGRTGPYGRGPETSDREDFLKARIYRATVTAAMLAAVLQAFGAAIKW